MLFYVIGEKQDGKREVLWPASSERRADRQVKVFTNRMPPERGFVKFYKRSEEEWLRRDNLCAPKPETVRNRAVNAFNAWFRRAFEGRTCGRSLKVRALARKAFVAGYCVKQRRLFGKATTDAAFYGETPST